MRDVQQRAIQWQVSAVYLPSGKDEQYTQGIVQRLQGHDLIQLLMGKITYPEVVCSAIHQRYESVLSISVKNIVYINIRYFDMNIWNMIDNDWF